MQSKAWGLENKDKAYASSKRWRDRQPKKEKIVRQRKTSKERNLKYRLKKRGFHNANISIACIPIDPKVRWSIYYERKKDDISATQKLYREANRERLQAAWVEWYSNNRVSQIERAAMRRKKVIDATPAWLTAEHRKQISAIYFLAVKITDQTGIKHEVDHIVPISGKAVCGLHVPWNLRVIPKLENIRKSNKLCQTLATA